MPRTITTTKALAAHLGVSRATVHKWKKSGILDKAILSQYGRIIIYDLDKIYTCLNHRPPAKGRPHKNTTQ